MLLDVGYGRGTQRVEVPDEYLSGILLPDKTAVAAATEELIRRALEEPIGSPHLREIVRPGEKVAIITSDITRPMPTREVMPALLDELYRAGAAAEDITLVFAIGSHRRHTDAERRLLAGERAWREIHCADSDPDDFVRMGITAAGTPVDITRAVAEADRRICLGNIEYHYFAGYSGGVKAIMPGVSTRAAIQHNHRLMTKPGARAGKLDGNPIREDIEDAGRICGADFILNVVLDEHKRIWRAFAGHPILAHREGCRLVDELYGKRLPQQAEIVLVAAGGYPKDINLYQAQKALDNAKYAVKDGGIIILVAACQEGLGERVFAQWLRSASTPEELTARIKTDFQLGGHKAAAIAMVLQRAEVFLVSDLEETLVRSLFMVPFHSAQEALDAAIEQKENGSKVLFMPCGGAVLPLWNG